MGSYKVSTAAVIVSLVLFLAATVLGLQYMAGVSVPMWQLFLPLALAIVILLASAVYKG